MMQRMCTCDPALAPCRYGFNPGSALAVMNGASAIVARVCATTTLGGAAGGLSTLFTQMVSSFGWMLACFCVFKVCPVATEVATQTQLAAREQSQSTAV